MSAEKKSGVPAGFEEVSSNWFKLTNVGDECSGVLVSKKIIDNTMKQPPVKQTIYTLLQEDGTTINIGGRGAQNPQVIAGLENCKMGQEVIVKYTESIPPKKAGFQAVKVVKVYTNGKINTEALKQYNGGSSYEEINEEDINFGA